MSNTTFYAGTERISAIAPPLGTILSSQLHTSTTYQAGINGYSETYYGSNLSRTSVNPAAGIPGTWISGTINSFEMRLDNELLVRIDAFSLPATEFNRTITEDIGIRGIVQTGNDIVTGSQFADQLYAGTGNDILFGGIGNDSFREERGSDLYDGGPGVDTVIATSYRRSETTLTQGSGNIWTLVELSNGETNTLRNIEYIKYSDSTTSLLDLALGSQTPPDAKGTQVYRFAKVDSGQYFYTGDIGERNLIISTLNNFRYEGPVFNAQDNWVTNYNPVYRFANLSNGGYFYTSSAVERDTVLSDYPSYRYEGASFFVPANAAPDTVPVYRLANVRTGGYLFTTSAPERQYAQSLGFFRDEGIAFNAPRTISLVDSGSTELLMNEDNLLVISGVDPIATGSTDWLIS